MSELALAGAARAGAIDRLGALIAAVAVAGGLALPFAVLKANRIVAGTPLMAWDALPGAWSGVLLVAGLLCIGLGIARSTPPGWRLAASTLALVALVAAMGVSAGFLTPDGDRLARVSPGAGFWVLLLAFGLSVTDALVRLRLTPVRRLLALGVFLAALTIGIASGLLGELSVMREYAVRADSFWREAQTHVELAFGALAAAALVGIPLGIIAQRVRPVRAGMLGVLNMMQTVPSIALFGLMIGPLAWIAANLPWARSLGISGIGAAPAFLALFIYALLPMVANTLAAIEGVPAAVVDAARGMGMTRWGRLLSVELPLGLPVILAGVRVVLVQSIGLATIAALIGGGGFGVFVFQGVGQTAMDLVLLGAVPTVILAMVSGIVMDAAVEMAGGRER